MPNDIVHRIRFDLRVKSKRQAQRVQDAASRFAAEKLPAILNRCLAGVAPDDRVLVFDRLDLDIGTLSEKSLEAQLPSRIARALGDALFVARYARAGNEQTQVRVASIDQRRREILGRFLEQGLFVAPEDPAEPATPDAILRAVLQNELEGAQLLKEWLRDRPWAARRLANQFSEAVLHRLIAAVSPQTASSLRIFIETLKQVREDDRNSLGSAAVWTDIWEIVLDAMLRESASQSSLETQVSPILDAVAVAWDWELDDLKLVLLAQLGRRRPLDSATAALITLFAKSGEHQPTPTAAVSPSEPAARPVSSTNREDSSEPAAATPLGVARDLMAATDRPNFIDRYVGRASNADLRGLLQALTPGFAGFIETVLSAIEAVDAADFPLSRSDPREPWRIALSILSEGKLLSEGNPHTLDLRRFVHELTRVLAAERTRPHRVYLDLLADYARQHRNTQIRYAPLMDVIASILENASATFRAPSAIADKQRSAAGHEQSAGEPREASVARDLMAAADKPNFIDRYVGRASNADLRELLQALTPGFAGFIETVLSAIEAVDATHFPLSRSDPREPWRIALSLLSEGKFLSEGNPHTLDLKRFAHELTLVVAAERTRPHLVYLDLLADYARQHRKTQIRYAPLVDVIASILENASATFRAPSAIADKQRSAAGHEQSAGEPREAPAYLERLLSAVEVGERGFPDDALQRAGLESEEQQAATREDRERGGPLADLDLLIHVIGRGDRPWWLVSGGEASLASALRVALDGTPTQTIAALRELDPPSVARSLVRYAPIELLRGFVDHLAPGLAGSILRFLSLISNRVARSDKGSGGAPWRIGIAILLRSPRPIENFERFVQETGSEVERALGLSDGDLHGIVDQDLNVPPNRTGEGSEREIAPDGAGETRRSPPRPAGDSDQEDVGDSELFGPPIVVHADEPDLLIELRYLIRYGTMPPGRRGIAELESGLGEALAKSREAAVRLSSVAARHQLARRNMTSLLSASALHQIGRPLFVGDNERALDFAADLVRAGAAARTGAAAVIYESLFREHIRTNRTIRPYALIRRVLGDVAAFEERPSEAVLLSWRHALARLSPPSPNAVGILRALQPRPPIRRPEPSSRSIPPPPISRDISIHVENAGLALLAPYFGSLFGRLELLEEGTFRGVAEQAAAIELTQYLAFGEAGRREHDLVLDKVLCGVEPSEPLVAARGLDDRSRGVCDSLLRSILQTWTPLKNSSIATLREAFLQRKGRLERGEDLWTLKVAAKPYDVLLDSLPWSYKLTKSRWMKTALRVEWR
jgi:hypothetical protein